MRRKSSKNILKSYLLIEKFQKLRMQGKCQNRQHSVQRAKRAAPSQQQIELTEEQELNTQFNRAAKEKTPEMRILDFTKAGQGGAGVQ